MWVSCSFLSQKLYCVSELEYPVWKASILGIWGGSAHAGKEAGKGIYYIPVWV